MTLKTVIAATSILAFVGIAQSQQTPDPTKPNPSAATSTGTSTSQAEMNRGVPGVDVDVGRNASNNVISGSIDRNTDSRNVTGDRFDATNGRMRAARADRG